MRKMHRWLSMHILILAHSVNCCIREWKYEMQPSSLWCISDSLLTVVETAYPVIEPCLNSSVTILILFSGSSFGKMWVENTDVKKDYTGIKDLWESYYYQSDSVEKSFLVYSSARINHKTNLLGEACYCRNVETFLNLTVYAFEDELLVLTVHECFSFSKRGNIRKQKYKAISSGFTSLYSPPVS